MRIAGLDIETTGLDFEKDQIVEIGYSIREFTNGLWHSKALAQGSFFIWEDGFPDPMPPEIYEIHKISSTLLKDQGIDYECALAIFENIYKTSLKVDFFLAHNGISFDKPFLEAKGFKSSIPWIDSKIHIEYPKACKQNSLMYLAAYHGFINPFPHDALSDVNTMFKIVQHYDFDKILKRAQEPWLKIKADVKFEGRELARARGYQWNQTMKQWEKNLPESELKAEREAAPFGVILL